MNRVRSRRVRTGRTVSFPPVRDCSLATLDTGANLAHTDSGRLRLRATNCGWVEAVAHRHLDQLNDPAQGPIGPIRRLRNQPDRPDRSRSKRPA